MPLISINALPLDEGQHINDIVKDISYAFSETMDIDIKHVSVVWQTIQGGHYAWNGQLAYHQEYDKHPVIVTVLVPDFYKPERISSILEKLAHIITQRINLPLNNIFISAEKARSGCVFDEGSIVRW